LCAAFAIEVATSLELTKHALLQCSLSLSKPLLFTPYLNFSPFG
jgi:hypothetical protein